MGKEKEERGGKKEEGEEGEGGEREATAEAVLDHKFLIAHSHTPGYNFFTKKFVCLKHALPTVSVHL